jgi:CoA:oxalate CoA-transferase
MRSGLPISDLVVGLYAALSIAAAVPHALTTGRGQRAEVSLTNGPVSLLAYIATNYFATGTTPRRNGNDHPIAAPYGLLHTSEGQIALAPALVRPAGRIAATQSCSMGRHVRSICASGRRRAE